MPDPGVMHPMCCNCLRFMTPAGPKIVEEQEQRTLNISMPISQYRGTEFICATCPNKIVFPVASLWKPTMGGVKDVPDYIVR